MNIQYVWKRDTQYVHTQVLSALGVVISYSKPLGSKVDSKVKRTTNSIEAPMLLKRQSQVVKVMRSLVVQAADPKPMAEIIKIPI